MKEIKEYTPGKWEIIENHPVFDNTKIIAVKDEENSNSFRDKYVMVCEMTDIRGDSFTDNSKYIEANATLIAAAPSLYEENIKLRKELDALHSNMQYYMEYCQANGYVTPMEWIEKHKHF